MPPRIVGYHHVNQSITRDCVEQARHFYRDLLGLEEISSLDQDPSGRLIWFALGDCQLHLAIRDKSEPSSPRHFAVLVRNFDELIRKLELEGARLDLCSPGQYWGRRPNGRKYAFCYDPAGNRIELMENID